MWGKDIKLCSIKFLDIKNGHSVLKMQHHQYKEF